MYMANASPNARTPNATYIPPARVRLVLGIKGSHWALLTRVGHYWLALGVALGPQGFLDINMLVLATRKSRVGGIAKHQREWLCIAVAIYALHRHSPFLPVCGPDGEFNTSIEIIYGVFLLLKTAPFLTMVPKDVRILTGKSIMGLIVKYLTVS